MAELSWKMQALRLIQQWAGQNARELCCAHSDDAQDGLVDLVLRLGLQGRQYEQLGNIRDI